MSDFRYISFDEAKEIHRLTILHSGGGKYGYIDLGPLDSVLAHGYLMSDKKIDNEYYEYIKSYKNIYFYKLKKFPSYGYLINNNDTIFDKDT